MDRPEPRLPGRPDRALRALSQAEPALIAALLRRLRPELLPGDATVKPEDVDDPHLPGPARERIGDWLVRIGVTYVIRVEYQGYHDEHFTQRLFEGHLACVVRYPGRTVVSVVLWLIRPRPDERRCEIELGNVRIKVEVFVLPDVPATLLLEEPRLACFAVGADRGQDPVRLLCQRVVEVMLVEGCSPLAWRVAGALAVARRRYKAWEDAMKQADVESHLFPEEREMYEAYFYDEGVRTGREEGLQEALLTAYRARFGRVPAAVQHAITTARSRERLLRWQRVVCTGTAGEIAAALQADSKPGRRSGARTGVSRRPRR